jgi:hypothetical protein
VTALPAPCEAGSKSRQHDPGSPQPRLPWSAYVPAPLGSEVHGFAREGEAMPLTYSHQGSWMALRKGRRSIRGDFEWARGDGSIGSSAVDNRLVAEVLQDD